MGKDLPAAVAVPLAGAAIGAAGSYLSGRSANKAADKRTAEANRLANEDYQRQLAWQQGLTGGTGMPGQLFGQLTGPQTSTGSGTSSMFGTTTEDSTQGLVKTPELLATRTRAAQAAGEVPLSLAGLLNQQFGNIARSEELGRTALQNRAAVTGASPQDIALATRVSPAAREATAARNAALLGVNQELFGRQAQARQEQSAIEQMLADQFRRGTSTTMQRGTSTSTQTGPGNIAAALGLLAPPQRQVYV